MNSSDVRRNDLSTLAPGTLSQAPLDEVIDGRYRLVGQLGRGASKLVYRAEDTSLGREVALAVIPAGDLAAATRERLEREVRASARLGDHPHIVTIHDRGIDGGRIFLVTQLVEGGSLAAWLKEMRPAGVPVANAVGIAGHIAAALAYAHGHQVVHRDVKPGNVLLTEDRSTALLADFGVAHLPDSSLTGAGDVVGTRAYMSPEQAQGLPVDARSDLYGLGATMFEMVCGRPPFPDAQPNFVDALVNLPVPDPRELNEAVPRPLADLIVRLLSKQPNDRPRSAREVEAALARMQTRAVRTPELLDRLPRPLDVRGARPYVGRGPALETLRRAWRSALTVPPSLCLVSGEPGIGKTRLAGVFAREVRRELGLVLYGTCDEDAIGSYRPFVDALRTLLARRPGVVEDLDPRLGRELRQLSRLVPELRDRWPPAEGSDSERYLLFEAVVAVLRAGTTAQPALLVLDDLQWADKPTILLLRHLMRAVPRVPVMILGTTRDDGLAPDRPLGAALADLHRDQREEPERFARVALAGLDEAETRTLVRARDDATVDAFVRFLHRETGGNPFFIEETLRELSEIEAAEGDAMSALTSLGVPAGAYAVIQRRLARLSPEVIDFLTAGAVCGRSFRLDIVAEMLGRAPSDLLRPLEEAIAAGLLQETKADHVTFCHALVRDALYGTVGSKAKRARLHLAAGVALERPGDGPLPVAELAHHFQAAAGLGVAQKAFDFGRQAATQAGEAAAYEEAAEHSAKALAALAELGPGHERDRFEVLHARGGYQSKAGDRGAAQATFLEAATVARALEDPERLASAALGYARNWYDVERLDRVLVDLLEEALGALAEGESSQRARLTSALADCLQFKDSRRAGRLSRDAVVMARRVGDPMALVSALGCRHNALLHVEHLDERLEVSHEWCERAEAARHGTAPALTWRIYDLVELGDADQARARHRRLCELADKLRQPLYRAFAASWQFNRDAMHGSFDKAEERAKEAFDLARSAQGTFAVSLYAGQLYCLQRDRGRLADFNTKVEKLVGAEPTLATWRAAYVAIRLESGDAEGAAADLAAIARDDFAAVRRDGFWLPAMCMLAEACAALGAPMAGALAQQLQPHAERNAQVGLAFYLGPVHHFLGLLAKQLGDSSAAERHFLAALDRSDELGAVTAKARTQCEYGELLLERRAARERQAGRMLLEQSRRTAGLLGMEGLTRRAEAAAAARLRRTAV